MGRVTAPEILVKQPIGSGDTGLVVTMDFSSVLPDGVVISSITSAVATLLRGPSNSGSEPAGFLPNLPTATHASGTTASVRVKGGQDRQDYKVQIRIVDSQGATHEGDGILSIRDGISASPSNQIVTMDDVVLLLGLTTSEQYQIALHCLKGAEGLVKKYLGYDPVQATRTEYYPIMDFVQNSVGIWEVNDDEAYIRQFSEAAADELQVKHIPIRSITSLYVDYDGRFGKRSGSFGASTQWTEGTDFWAQYDLVDSSSNTVCSDGIIRSQGRWPNNPGSVKITYVAGYSDNELRGLDSVIDARPIYDVVIDETMRHFHRIQHLKKQGQAGFAGPLSSESLGDYSYSADTSAREKMIGQGGGELSPDNAARLSPFVNMGAMLAS